MLWTQDRYRQVVLSDSPAGYWRLRESSGTTVVDSSGNGRNGTLENAWTYHSTGPTRATPTYALDVNGATSDIVFGISPWSGWTNTHPFTIEAWIKNWGTGSTAPCILGNTGSSPAFTGMEFTYRATTQLAMQLSNNWGTGNSILVSANTATNMNDGNWHHVVWTYSGSSTAAGCRCFVDSVECSYTISGNSLTASTASASPLAACQRRSAAQLQAPVGSLLAELAIYPTALSPSRIAVHYNTGKLGA